MPGIFIRWNLFAVIWLLNLEVAHAGVVVDHPGAPVGLLVDGVVNPQAIDGGTPRFSWRDAGTNRGAVQTAFQILIYSNAPNPAADRFPLWDGGKVASDRSGSIEYSGPPLASGRRFYWKVRIWDGAGHPGPYSALAYFDTGIEGKDWQAKYIWDGTSTPNNFAYFRKIFVLPETPALSKVYVTAGNEYLLYFNGELLGRGPARCDPYHYGQYNAYDISGLAKKGSNVFAAIGHWHGMWNNSGVNAQPGFLLQAQFDLPASASIKIATDATWKVLADTAFIESNATYFGATGGASNRAAIRYDSRREPAGWQTAGFEDVS